MVLPPGPGRARITPAYGVAAPLTVSAPSGPPSGGASTRGPARPPPPGTEPGHPTGTRPGRAEGGSRVGSGQRGSRRPVARPRRGGVRCARNGPVRSSAAADTRARAGSARGQGAAHDRVTRR